jgi:hypothetical protein
MRLILAKVAQMVREMSPRGWGSPRRPYRQRENCAEAEEEDEEDGEGEDEEEGEEENEEDREDVEEGEERRTHSHDNHLLWEDDRIDPRDLLLSDDEQGLLPWEFDDDQGEPWAFDEEAGLSFDDEPDQRLRVRRRRVLSDIGSIFNTPSADDGVGGVEYSFLYTTSC